MRTRTKAGRTGHRAAGSLDADGGRGALGSMVVRPLVVALLAAHGAVHAMGFAAVWGLAEVPEVSQTPMLPAGLAPGSPPVLLLGALWLAAMGAFLAAAAGLALGASWWLRTAAVAAALSLLLCVAWWDDAWFGAVVDVAILAGLGAASRVARPKGA